MNLPQALSRLRGRDDWEAVLDYLSAEKFAAMQDFQNGDLLDNPQKLARLAGEIAALDRIQQTLLDEPSRGGEAV